MSGCYFGSAFVSIEEGTYINRECFFDSAAPITIGRNCSFGMQVALVTSSHEVGNSHRRAGPLRVAAIDVGDGTWLGARVLVMPGVSIGSGCVIAAGAVVTSDCEPNSMYAGVPARLVRAFRDE